MSAPETHNECCCKCGELMWEFNDQGYRVKEPDAGRLLKICSSCVDKMLAGEIRRESLVMVFPEEKT